MSKEELLDNKAIKDDVETDEVKTYTEEDLQKLLQSETDRRVTSAQKKWEAEYKERLEAEKSQASELASMTAEERARAEFEQEKSEWLKERESFEKEKMKLEATKLLDAEGLPISFVDYVVDGTAEEVIKNVKTFKDSWEKALDEAITERLKGRAPNASGLHSKDLVNMTKEEFNNLPYKERARMLEIDPDILDKLKK